MAEATNLQAVRRRPYAPLVTALEKFLQEAKDGKIRGMVGVIETGYSSQHFQIGEFNKANEATAILQMIKEW